MFSYTVGFLLLSLSHSFPKKEKGGKLNQMLNDEDIKEELNNVTASSDRSGVIALS